MGQVNLQLSSGPSILCRQRREVVSAVTVDLFGQDVGDSDEHIIPRDAVLRLTALVERVTLSDPEYQAFNAGANAYLRIIKSGFYEGRQIQFVQSFNNEVFLNLIDKLGQSSNRPLLSLRQMATERVSLFLLFRIVTYFSDSNRVVGLDACSSLALHTP